MSETVADALNTIRVVVEAGRAAEDRLLEIRRQLPQYDCRRTGGPVSDSGGKHCPPESPCLTCRCERAEAEVERLKWELAGAPQRE